MSTENAQSQQDLKTLRVIMAEDDKLNQALGKALLKKMGCFYEIVDNGRILLEKIKNTAFDIILMDVEMPEVNGYEATKVIRNELAAPLSQIPIIAVTAHINELEIKKCLDTGMNGFIYKPIKFEELISKIRSVLSGDVDEIVVPKKPSEDENEFNLKSLYIACGNNQVTVKNIIKIFITQNSGNIKQLKEFIRLEDWPNLKNLCHKMKAVYSLIGLPKVKMYLEEMEESCAKNDINISKFESHIMTIELLHTDVLPKLEEILKN